MMEPTPSFPFGRDVDTLIICRDEGHRRSVSRALAIPARYEIIGSPLPGRGYAKIIVMVGQPSSSAESDFFTRMIRENLNTKLKPDGEMHVL